VAAAIGSGDLRDFREHLIHGKNSTAITRPTAGGTADGNRDASVGRLKYERDDSHHYDISRMPLPSLRGHVAILGDEQFLTQFTIRPMNVEVE
jgi:hypothetical protein